MNIDTDALCPPPSPRMLKWIRLKLAAQEKADGKPAPRHYHDYIAMAERVHSRPVQVEILTGEDWERFYASAFAEEE